jgi:acyl carrier protein
MLKIKKELDNIFFLILKIPVSKKKNNLNFTNTKKWDSLNHIKLILAVESRFNIKIDLETTATLMSYDKILNFLKDQKIVSRLLKK